MNHILIPFLNSPWKEAAPHCRVKEAVRGRRRLRLVEFQNGFHEADWCEKGHVGYVLKGALDIEFPDRIVRVEAGDGLWIPGGYETRHRARVIGESVQLILFEDVD